MQGWRDGTVGGVQPILLAIYNLDLNDIILQRKKTLFVSHRGS